ncbi:uncharacterized mitochondrial protein AtMg00310-like [Hibiscus syriacus]|uniref:uncharacterized mitochondrial protein AtMg00310-like n=1 Tax=Hibiscus syriacus TaxID=106335 RepID=UPI001921BB41|nr:uncharacterized mitochondrial protein AtMg00310-like [Hibiscus syriacus]
MQRYWWSGDANKRGWPMVAWKTMCKPKREGGLGFRDLYSFNLALLGKQFWCFIKEPDSLVASVFRAKYFPNGDILHATLKDMSSFAWKGCFLRRMLCRFLMFQLLYVQRMSLVGAIMILDCIRYSPVIGGFQRRFHDNERKSKLWSIIAKLKILPKVRVFA